MKKISYALLSSAVFTSFAVAAESAPVQVPSVACNFSGFYAGAAIGYGAGKAKTTKIRTQNGAGDYNASADLSISGVDGGIFLGYGKELGASRVYVGLDLGYFFSGAKGKTDLDGIRVLEIKKKDGFELAARLGFAFNNSLPYIKLGWANTKFQGTQKVLDRDDLVNTTFLTQKFLNKRLNGFIAGAGIDVKLSRHVTAGLEYSYVMYQNKGSQQAVGSATAVDNANNWNSKMKLNDNKFRLRLAYNF